jgi:parvulin-like peptidyl-prolyl isomerase
MDSPPEFVMKRSTGTLALASAMAFAYLLAAAPRALAAEPTQPTEYAARHILLAYQGAERASATRTKVEAMVLAEKAFAEAKAPGADFAALSATYSDDKVSNAQGGFLGVFKPGQMTPAFQAAVASLAEGEFGFVETPFGFHVVQRMTMADAVVALGKNTAAFLGVVFPFKGSRDAQCQRAKELALEDAGRVVALLRGGGSFDTIPAEWDARPLGGPGMPMTLRRGTVRPEFKALETAAFATAMGEVSEPFETSAGYMVIKRVPWWRAHLQHFLVMHKDSERVPPQITRTKEEAKARAEEGLKKLEADPTAWARIVAEYSDEPGAGQREGDLGTVEPGMMVPSFDLVVSTIPSKGRSVVFETPFGYHVVRRVD